MMNWLRLIRYKNLLIVFMTQLLVWYCLIYGSLDMMKLIMTRREWVPGSWSFVGGATFLEYVGHALILPLSTMLIASAGYIINDYFDLKIDVINRPEKVVLEKRIPLRAAIIAHSTLNIAGFFLAGMIAYKAGHLEWLLVQLLSTILLWFYSTHFKRQYIVGNVVVAFLTGLTVALMLIYYPSVSNFFIAYPALIPISEHEIYINPIWMCAGFCFFAFMLTWMREIVKDMEDYKGDASEGCMTMPIKKGLQFSARFAQALGAITIITLSVISYFFITNKYLVLGIYTIALIILPLIWWCMYIAKKNTIEHYGNASKWLKFIMLSGIASLIVYHFSIQQIQ